MSEFPRQNLGERLKGIIELFNEIKEFLPIIMQAMECLREMSPETRSQVANLIGKRITDDDEVRAKFVESIKAIQ